MADHDYKQGGWRDKYRLSKVEDPCGACEGLGYVRVPGGTRFCQRCDGTGVAVIPVDLDAVYLVVRLDEDPHAAKAARAYAESVRSENPEFADDILAKLAEIEGVEA